MLRLRSLFPTPDVSNDVKKYGKMDVDYALDFIYHKPIFSLFSLSHYTNDSIVEYAAQFDIV